MKATSTSKNLGHNYWEVFVNHNPTTTAKNVNALQVRTHNKEFLKAYKKVVWPSDTRNTSDPINIGTPMPYKKKIIKAHPSYFAEPYVGPKFSGRGLSKAEKELRSEIFSRECSGEFDPRTFRVDTINSRYPTVTANTQNFNKRFLRSKNFAKVNNLTLNNGLTSN